MPIIKEHASGFFKKERLTSEFITGQKGLTGGAGDKGDQRADSQ